MQGGGGSPEQSQRVVFGRQLDENYSQTSARRTKPRFWPQARALAFNAKGGEPAEATEWHPRLNPSEKLTITVKQSVLTDDVKANAKGEKSAGFTMAEILLSLTIIGVVAAITLPSLTGNINERTWNTQRKALYARFSQAIALMPSLNGYGTLTEDESGSVTEDTAAETFITAGLSKVLKINNICDSDHLEDCGIPKKFTTFTGSMYSSFPKTFNDLNPIFVSHSNGTYDVHFYSSINTKAAAFETANGESIVLFYNPRCLYEKLIEGSWAFRHTQPYVCANFVYDLNGTKGPNTIGKDMGTITALYASDSVVIAPQLYDPKKSVKQSEASKVCSSAGNYIWADQNNIISIFVNQNLWGLEYRFVGTSTKFLYQGNIANSYIRMYTGEIAAQIGDESTQVLCVERN